MKTGGQRRVVHGEPKVLVNLAVTDPGQKRLQQTAALIREGIDWALLLRSGFRHKTLPILYHNLKAHFFKDVPPPVMRQLGVNHEMNRVQNERLAHALTSIVKVFETHGAPVIPHKGPVLAKELYGHLALRSAGDLDLLVNRGDVSRAVRLLEEQGY